jgi:hypothetical protein
MPHRHVRPGVLFAELQTAPTESRLRIYTAAIMRRVNQPDVLNTGSAVATKWERLRVHPRELLFVQPVISWRLAPDLAGTPESRVKNIRHFILITVVPCQGFFVKNFDLCNYKAPALLLQLATN